MSILKICKMGNPLLRRISRELTKEEIGSNKIQKLIDDMIDTMREEDGAGIAAIQVFEPVRIFMVELNDNDRYPFADDIPLKIFINPQIISKSKKTDDGWEGCLSVENIRAKVPRSKKIKIKALDREAQEFTIEVSDFFARAVLHEYDHLDGLIFMDRVRDTTTLTHFKEYQRFHI